MFATVFAAKICDYGDVGTHTVRRRMGADLDRFETMRARLFSLLPEDDKWTTVLEKGTN
jgi:hypothetical protein